jgi:predicted Abi (CAAX) family protease
LAIFAAIAVPFGLATGFLSMGTPPPWQRLLVFALVAVFVPCLGEELLFRAALLPRPEERIGTATRLVITLLSLALFVAWHPLNAAMFLHAAWPTFTDSRFLILAAVLGACCSAAYLRSGSVWPGVAIHWIAVVAWKLLGGAFFRYT